MENRRVIADFEELGLLSAEAMDARGLDWAVPAWAPLDQGPTGTCLCNAWCLGEVVNLKARHDADSPLPSRMAAYYWAKLGEGAFVDDGSRPSDLLLAVSKQGLPPESAWPFKLSLLGRQPGMGARWDAKSHAGQRRSYQIYYSTLADRISACRSAIASGRPLILSIPVDKAFNRYAGGFARFPNASDVLGHHAVLILDVDRDGQAYGINSWGASWGQNGRFLLDSSFLEQSFSVVVMDVERGTL